MVSVGRMPASRASGARASKAARAPSDEVPWLRSLKVSLVGALIAAGLIEGQDLVIDCSDAFETRYAVNAAWLKAAAASTASSSTPWLGALVDSWLARHQRSRALPRDWSSSIKPCRASWRR